MPMRRFRATKRRVAGTYFNKLLEDDSGPELDVAIASALIADASTAIADILEREIIDFRIKRSEILPVERVVGGNGELKGDSLLHLRIFEDARIEIAPVLRAQSTASDPWEGISAKVGDCLVIEGPMLIRRVDLNRDDR